MARALDQLGLELRGESGSLAGRLARRIAVSAFTEFSVRQNTGERQYHTTPVIPGDLVRSPFQALADGIRPDWGPNSRANSIQVDVLLRESADGAAQKTACSVSQIERDRFELAFEDCSAIVVSPPEGAMADRFESLFEYFRGIHQSVHLNEWIEGPITATGLDHTLGAALLRIMDESRPGEVWLGFPGRAIHHYGLEAANPSSFHVGLEVRKDSVRITYTDGSRRTYPVAEEGDAPSGTHAEDSTLPGAVAGSSASRSPRTRTIPDVFVCYASDDHEAAETIKAHVESLGLHVWLDTEALKGGDDWDTVIQRTIDSVRVVIVLQSSALLRKQEGYVNREIHLALRRQETFRDGTFVIPVVVDDASNVLPALKEIQYVKFFESDGPERLTAALGPLFA